MGGLIIFFASEFVNQKQHEIYFSRIFFSTFWHYMRIKKRTTTKLPKKNQKTMVERAEIKIKMNEKNLVKIKKTKMNSIIIFVRHDRTARDKRIRIIIHNVVLPDFNFFIFILPHDFLGCNVCIVSWNIPMCVPWICEIYFTTKKNMKYYPAPEDLCA